MTQKKIGVLVMSYGTPQSLDQIEAYYTHIRRGHPPTPAQVAELRSRYEAIVGGFFPLREHTNKQVEALEQALNREANEVEYRCYQGLKHASPFIEDGLDQMKEDGIEEALGIVLAPHYSVMSVGGYIQRAQAKADEVGITMRFIKSYHLHPLLIQALSIRLKNALQQFPEADREQVHVIFSAHSLPEKIVEMKDPYPQQLLETSQAIIDQVPVKHWQFAWQSAGKTSIPWLGPDILDVIRDVHDNKGVKQIIISPIGFVSDHLEVLYDIDIEAQALANDLGLKLVRTHSLNTDPLYIQTLADVLHQERAVLK